MFENQVINVSSITDFVLNKNYLQKTAIIYEKNEISYKELGERINYTKEVLCSLGVEEGDYVILKVNKDIDYVVILLTLFKIGAIIIPIDPEAPLERYQKFLHEKIIKLIINNEEQEVKKYFSSLYNYVPLILTPKLLLSVKANNLSHNENPINLLNSGYIMFTSGTTGVPKGVLINQKNILYYLHYLSKRLPINLTDIFVHLASIGFSSSMRQLLLPLMKQSTIILVDEENRKDLSFLFNNIVAHRVTVLDITPSHLSALLAFCAENLELSSEMLKAQLRLILTASEPLLKSVVEDSRKIFGNIQFINMYGQTESSGIVCTETVNNLDIYSTFVHIGYPLDCVELKIFSNSLEIVPKGEQGEIWIYSPTLTQHEYIGSDNSFHFCTELNKRFFRTGDLGREFPNGSIEYCGRISNFVMVRGARISLEEIKSQILKNDHVLDAVLIILNEISNTATIGVLLVPKPGKIIEIEQLKKFLSTKLPAYMLPSQYKITDTIPTNNNYKIDYNIVKEKFKNNNQNIKSVFIDDLEQRIAQIWQAVFNNENITRDDNFYSLGGNSLIAARIAAQINKTLSANVKLTDILQKESIENLVSFIKKINK